MSSTFDRDLLATYLLPELPRVALLGVLLCGGIGLQIANPLIARTFIDGAQAGESFDHLLSLAIMFTAVALATQVATVAETYLAEDLGWRTTNALRVDLTRRVLDLDSSFHAAHNPGELVERVDGDVSAIAGFFSRFVVQVLGNAVFLLGVLTVLYLIDVRIGAVLTVFAVAALVFMTRGGGFVRTRSRAARAAVGDLSGYLEERLGGLPDLKANGADDHAIRGLHEHMAARYHGSRAATLASSTFSMTISTMFVLGSGASLALSAALHHNGTISLGTVFAVFRYTTMLRFPLEQLSRQMNVVQQAAGGLSRVRELLDTHPSVVDGPGAGFAGGALAVSLDHVSFSYSRDLVLRDVCLDIDPGSVLGLLGRTGSGKTTIARLVFRLHDASSGCVRVGGVDVREATLDELRSRIGLVTQEVQLFEGTVRDNVTLFDSDVPDDRLRDVFTSLGLDGWLDLLPDGLDTVIDAGSLSAGEAQLLAFARVFLADPGVVILDEASSRLDPATEHLLEAAMTRLLTGRTAIVIAHRLRTVERANRIAIIDHGSVVEAGPRAALAADPSSRLSQLRRLALT